MKSKIYALLCLLSVAAIRLSAQDTFELKALGISFQVPSEWQKLPNKAFMKELEKPGEPEKQVTEWLAAHDDMAVLMTFMKYGADPNVKEPLDPTIHLVVKPNPTQNFSDFKNHIEQTYQEEGSYYSAIDYKIKPTEVELAGTKALYYAGDYTVPKNKNNQLVFERRYYMIPHGAYYFILVFTDGTTAGDYSALFDKVLETVKVEKG